MIKKNVGLLLEKVHIATTDIEIAEILNNHFGNVFTSERLNNFHEFN